MEKKEDKKTKIITLAAIAFAIIAVMLGIFLYLQAGKQALKVQPVDFFDCENIENTYFGDACYLQLAVNQSDESFCYKLLDSLQKDVCFIKIAKLRFDKTICAEITDKFYLKPKCYAELQMLGVV